MSKSSQQKSRELLERYLQAVRFWLPKSQQADITAELSEDLRSQVDDKEAELGHPLDEAEMMAILKRCGNPIVVASRYRPQTHLIGPVLFPIYQFVLKLVLLWVLIPMFLVLIGPGMILTSPHHWGAFVTTLGALWTTLFMSAAVITLVFAVLERTGAKLQLADKWDMRSLPPLSKQAQPPSRTQSVFEVIFGIIGLLWLLAVPHYPFLILGPAVSFLKPAPIWHTFYVPIVLLSFAGLAHQCISLMRPQWTWFPSAARLLTTVLSLVLLHYVIDAASQTPSGAWHPFVVLANSAQTSLQHNRVEAIVNASILLALVCTWFGLCIAGVIQTWELLRQFRKHAPRACDPAVLRFF